MEESELFCACAGFDATRPFLFDGQPRGLTTLDTPVLLLWGTLDMVLLPRQGRRFARLIPGAELRYLPGLGHTPMSDAPEELADAIAEFALERPRARRSAQAAVAGS
jgi:pimeloyl-ACP methyl ester carboxylesterase